MLLFVYGTLKRGLCRSPGLRGQQCLGPARTRPRYRMVNCGGYPGLIRDEQHGRSIDGELWRVDEACLARLDVVEGVAQGLYAREAVELMGVEDAAIAYFYRRPTEHLPDAGTCWQPRPSRPD